jgi:hypothetical protein
MNDREFVALCKGILLGLLTVALACTIVLCNVIK